MEYYLIQKHLPMPRKTYLNLQNSRIWGLTSIDWGKRDTLAESISKPFKLIMIFENFYLNSIANAYIYYTQAKYYNNDTQHFLVYIRKSTYHISQTLKAPKGVEGIHTTQEYRKYTYIYSKYSKMYPSNSWNIIQIPQNQFQLILKRCTDFFHFFQLATIYRLFSRAPNHANTLKIHF